MSHSQLLHALTDAGMRVYSLMESYLKDRTQIVRIEAKYSSVKNINFGIPQRTVLGPTLCILYTNNIFTHHTVGDILSFADKTVIIYSAKT